ncbi:MAG: ABC transporter substrate-binding protein [Clostridiales bacterium]|nr:ABC transporter substrate-binding protein [Clostridiales bacterium]
MKRIVSCLAALALLMGICSCSTALFPGTADKPDEPSGSTADKVEVTNDISIGMYDFDTFNPLVTKSQTVKEAMEFIYEPLFTLDTQQMVVPVLAKEMTVSADGTTIELTLKDNVRWHDGDMFNAYDVAYTIKQIRNGLTTYGSNLKNLADYRILDDYKISLTFNWSAPNLITLLTFPIVKYQTNMYQGDSYNPIGTGAFKFDGKIGTDRYRMSAFDGYRDGRAKLDYVYIDAAPSAEAYLKMYGTGQFDVATSDVINLAEYTPKGSVLINNYISNNLAFVGCNNANEKLSGSMTRRALSKLIDRDYIVSSVIYSRGQAVEVPINPSTWLYTEEEKEFSIDASAAYELLEADGWQSEAAGGFTRDVNGQTQRLSLTILVNSDNAERVRIAEKMRKDFNEYGVSAVVEQLPYEQYTQRITSGQYELFVGEYKLDPTLDLTPLLSSSGNYFAYGNEQVDTVIGQMGMTTDEENLKILFAQFAQVLKEDMPFIPLYYATGSMMCSAKIKAIANPSCAMAYNEVSKWAVK